MPNDKTRGNLGQFVIGHVPLAIPDSVVAHPGSGPWLRLDLTGWRREARGVPVYPQGRACNGLAEGIVARYGGRLLIRVVQRGRTDRWTGRRTSV